MPFQTLLRELDSLGLPAGEYAITSSGPLAVRGIRPAGDIDLIVTDRLWAKLSAKYGVTMQGNNGSIRIGNIEVLGDFQGERLYPSEEQIAKADIIDGHRYVNLEMICSICRLRSDITPKNTLSSAPR